MNLPRLSFAPRILQTFDGHGAYIEAYGEHYFLCAADLNEHLAPGTSWEDPEAQRRAVLLLVAEIEAESSASTPGGSLRFPDLEDYAQHRHDLDFNIRAFRAMVKVRASAMRLTETVTAIKLAR